MVFKKIEIDVKGCQSSEQFFTIAKYTAKGLKELAACVFGTDYPPAGCCESGDYCEDCFKDNVKIVSNELNIEFDEWEDLD